MQERVLEWERWEAKLECREQETHPSGGQEAQQGGVGAAPEAHGYSEREQMWPGSIWGSQTTNKT